VHGHHAHHAHRADAHEADAHDTHAANALPRYGMANRSEWYRAAADRAKKFGTAINKGPVRAAQCFLSVSRTHV